MSSTRRVWMFRLILFTVSVMVALAIGEIVARMYVPPMPAAMQMMGRYNDFKTHPNLVFTNVHEWLVFSDRADVDKEHLDRAGLIKIACVGGSTTNWQYPRFLAEELNKLGFHDIVVMECAAGNYSTREMELGLLTFLIPQKPDVVVAMEAYNDVPPRMHPGYRTDYAHYRMNPGDIDMKPSIWDHSRLIVWMREVTSGYLSKRRFLEANVTRKTDWADIAARKKCFEENGTVGYRQHMTDMAIMARGAGAEMVYIRQPRPKRFIPWYQEDMKALSGGVLTPLAELWDRGIQEFNDCLVEIAAKEGATVVPFDVEAAAVGDKIFRDHIHLNEEGNRLEAAAVARAVAPLLKKRAATTQP